MSINQTIKQAVMAGWHRADLAARWPSRYAAAVWSLCAASAADQAQLVPAAPRGPHIHPETLRVSDETPAISRSFLPQV